MIPLKPSLRPENPSFASGPCAKRPGWDLIHLKKALVQRSHRSVDGKVRLQHVVNQHRSLLGIPADYCVAIVPGGDTGAFEMALWGMLGACGVDVLAWDAFGEEWLYDIEQALKIPDLRKLTAPYGRLPDLTKVDCDRDVVFTWNGTTSGVCVPNGEWIDPGRKGLTFCDATSAVFAYDMPWDRLDITTWSWQKVLGGEGAHGMIVLSPRAVERLRQYQPDRPIPRLFRMAKSGSFIEGIFAGETINTPSMLAVEDCADALRWVEDSGGLVAAMDRVKKNYEAIATWVGHTAWADFLCGEESCRSRTSICLSIVESGFQALDEISRRAFIKNMCGLLEQEKAAFDIASHARAPAGLRIWCGATVESSDVTAMLPWLDWAFQSTKNASGVSGA